MALAMHTAVHGQLVDLLPMQAEHAPQLLPAAAYGDLWNMTVTLVPGPDIIALYIAASCQTGASATPWVSASSIRSGRW